MAYWILGSLLLAFAGLTVLPFSKNPAWWVRGADFPRVQLSVLGVALLILEGGLLDRDSPATWIMLGLTVAGIACQAYWIFPYTKLHPFEVKDAGVRARENSLRILSVNVLMTNRDTSSLRRIVNDAAPDLLVTLETNRRWETELRPLEKDFPHRLCCPLENLYGMHLYSKLPLEDSRLQFLVEKDVPSMHTLVVLPSGRRVRLHCLHPAPPSPTENPTSKERDAELVMVGKSVVEARFPVVVTGDLNDVAWSATTRLFRKVSGLLDPRIGRGMFNTFHARLPFMRWPVDHIFHSKDFSLVRLERLPYCGSDHFPVLIELTLDGRAQANQEGLSADASDHAEALGKMSEESANPHQVHRPGEASPRARKNSKRS